MGLGGPTGGWRISDGRVNGRVATLIGRANRSLELEGSIPVVSEQQTFKFNLKLTRVLLLLLLYYTHTHTERQKIILLSCCCCCCCCSNRGAAAHHPHLTRTPQEGTFLALRLPRRAYTLSLRLPHRVEPGSASVQLFSDHMSVRLPLLHPGSAIPERELRAGRRLPCNVCRGALLLQPGATAAAAGDRGAPAPHPPLRAHLLPSEHLLEWSDLCICHGEEHNAFAFS